MASGGRKKNFNMAERFCPGDLRRFTKSSNGGPLGFGDRFSANVPPWFHIGTFTGIYFDFFRGEFLKILYSSVIGAPRNGMAEPVSLSRQSSQARTDANENREKLLR